MFGLPRLLTGCIIAHELMHAWLRMRNIASLDPQVEEGLCQLMAMLWLDRQNDMLKVIGEETGAQRAQNTTQRDMEMTPLVHLLSSLPSRTCTG